MARLSAVSANDAGPFAEPAAAGYLSQSPSADITSTGDIAVDALSAFTNRAPPKDWAPPLPIASARPTSLTWIEGYAEPRDGFQPLSEGQRAAVRTALAAWERVSNIDFVEVKETASSEGDIRFGVSNLPPTADSPLPRPVHIGGRRLARIERPCPKQQFC